MQIVATGFGNPDVLEAVPSEERTPGKGEVTIAVRAAAVNPRDLRFTPVGTTREALDRVRRSSLSNLGLRQLAS